jgi:hypothetical protein
LLQAAHYVYPSIDMAGGSLLTQGLESLGGHSRAIRSKLTELYALDDELQASHQQAKRDDDLGEEVVTKYKAFLGCRQQLIAELERQKIPVPWQLRMTIDDLELTVRTTVVEQKTRILLLCVDPCQFVLYVVWFIAEATSREEGGEGHQTQKQQGEAAGEGGFHADRGGSGSSSHGTVWTRRSGVSRPHSHLTDHRHSVVPLERLGQREEAAPSTTGGRAHCPS